MTIDYRLFSSGLDGYEREIDSLFSARAGQRRRAASDGFDTPDIPPCSYLICFVNRSGSTVLGQALARTRLMDRPAEFFNPEPIANVTARENLASFQEYLLWCIRRTSTPNRMFGAKVGVHQLVYLAKHGLIRDCLPGCRFLFVTRRDVIMQAVSLAIAWQTGAWTHKLPAGREPTFDVESIGRQLQSIITTQSEFDAFFSAHGLSPLRLAYEEIEDDLGDVVARVAAFLNIQRPPGALMPKANLQIQRTDLNYAWARHFVESCQDALSPDGRGK